MQTVAQEPPPRQAVGQTLFPPSKRFLAPQPSLPTYWNLSKAFLPPAQLITASFFSLLSKGNPKILAISSFASLEVMPEIINDIDIVIEEKDLKVDTFRSSGAGGQHVNKTESAIRITHLPTGIVVACQDERSQIKNREKAMKTLKSKLYDHFQSQAEKEYADARRMQVGTGDRSERIRTYNFPQGRVTDHRIGLTLYSLDTFMDGDIEEMIEALRLADQTAKLQGNKGE